MQLESIDIVRLGRPILMGVRLNVPAGGCCAVLGPNGSGKSTLLSVLSGYTWPTAGTVRVGGELFGRVDLGRVRRTIGLIEPSRSPSFDSLASVRDVVATGLFGTLRLPFHRAVESSEWRQVDAQIESFGLADLRDAVFAQLSTGEQMKALLARAMAADARLLLLDEPTAGLDLGARAACMGILDRLLNRPGHPTVVIVSHHLDELPRLVDQVILLKGGRVFADGPPDRVLTSERLSGLFDCQIQVLRTKGRYVATASDGFG